MPEIHPWVVVGRITAMIGMGLTLSVGILLLLGALWAPAVIALLLTVPFFVLMLGVERSKAARSMTGKPPDAIEP